MNRTPYPVSPSYPRSPRAADRESRSRLFWTRSITAAIAITALVASACGDDGDTSGSETPSAATAGEARTILVTTGIWADVVSNVACGGLADIETIIPVGGDPHGFEPSLQDRARMENADLVVANGLELEEGLEDTLEAVAESGVPVFEFADGMEAIPFAFEGAHHGEGHGDEAEEEDHDEGAEADETEEEGHHDEGAEADETEEAEEEGHHDEDGEEQEEAEEEGHHDEDEAEEEGHHDEDEAEEEGHGSGGDPHVWFDPVRVSGALSGLARVLIADVGLDSAAVEACLADFQAELEAVNADIAAKVEQLPAENRKLVTNHEALGYFADRYGFEVIGTVIPTPASMAQANPAGLEELAEIIEHEGIKAIFAETLHSVDDVEALADRVGDVDVVTLYTGSLGPAGSGAETYAGFMRTNADLIVAALG